MSDHSFIYVMALLAEVLDKKNLPEKRKLILSAAVNIFSKQGFYNSTVADVAREAKVADGTIYLYFKNKDDLLISIFEHSMDFFIESAHEELKKGGRPQEKLSRFINLHLSLVRENQSLAQVLQIELRQSSQFIKDYANAKFVEYLNILRSIIAEGQSEGVFKSELNPGILKRAMFGAIDEMALEWVLNKKKKYSTDEVAENLSQLFIEGLLKT